MLRCFDGSRTKLIKYNYTLASSVKEPLVMDSCGVVLVSLHFPFLLVSKSTIFWYSDSFDSFLNFDPSFLTFRLNISFIVSLLKNI